MPDEKISPIDRTARDRGVEILQMYRDGRKEESLRQPWPESDDPALSAIADLEQLDMALNSPLAACAETSDAESSELYLRYAILLKSDKPYLWPEGESDPRYWPVTSREQLVDDLHDMDQTSLHSHQMRLKAADMLLEYLDNNLSKAELCEGWPVTLFEQVLVQMKQDVLELVPGGSLESIFNETEKLHVRDLVTRCRLFLLSNRSYRWTSLFEANGLGSILWISAFLVIPLAVLIWFSAIAAFWATAGVYVALCLLTATIAMAYWLWPSRRRLRCLLGGKYRYWPFESEADLQAAREAHSDQ